MHAHAHTLACKRYQVHTHSNLHSSPEPSRGRQPSGEEDLLFPALKPRLTEPACSTCTVPVCTRGARVSCSTCLCAPGVTCHAAHASARMHWLFLQVVPSVSSPRVGKRAAAAAYPAPHPPESWHPEAGWWPHRRGHCCGNPLGPHLVVRGPVLGKRKLPLWASHCSSHSVQGATGGGYGRDVGN